MNYDTKKGLSLDTNNKKRPHRNECDLFNIHLVGSFSFQCTQRFCGKTDVLLAIKRGDCQ